MKSASAVLAALCLTLLLVGTGCSGTRYRTGARFDTTYDFSTVKTFAFAPQREKVATSASGEILKQAIREQLVSRGYEEIDSGKADVLISYDVGVYAKASLSGSNSFPRREGGLTVQVLDAESGRSVWYGWSETVVREGDDREVVIGAATAALFDDHIPVAD
jgi:hypothetical protein